MTVPIVVELTGGGAPGGVMWKNGVLTRTGHAMQAVAQNRALAASLGIDVSRMVEVTSVLNAVLTAVAALLIAPVYLVKYDIGIGLGLKAFAAAIVGGFNEIRGALVGGLAVGLVEAYGAAYVSSQYREGVLLLVMIVVLLWKPGGLAGVRPRLVLLDEPTLGLSPLLTREVFGIIQEIHRQGVAILMVEQNAYRALEIAHHAYVLDLGLNRYAGPAAEIRTDLRVRELYLGGR